jgi:drug/metabolite transporter (DMT)-like permease
VVGITCALCVLFIWSSWLVVSRYGVLSNLTIFDLAALRYGISGIIVLPIVLYYKPWKTISIFKIIILSILLGPIYMLFVFGGFIYSPAAHSGVFMNGSLPLMTMIISYVWLKEKASALQLIGISLILVGATLIVIDGTHLNIAKSWLGDTLFLIAGIFFSGYMVVSKVWRIKTTELFLCSSLVNCIFYIPIWYIFLPKNINQVSNNELLIQGLYQGIVPTLIGLILVTIAVRNIGSSSTSAFLAGVPGLATILSMLFLNEYLGLFGWLGLLLLTPGILTVAINSK